MSSWGQSLRGTGDRADTWLQRWGQHTNHCVQDKELLRAQGSLQALQSSQQLCP